MNAGAKCPRFLAMDSVVWPNNNHLASHFVFREHEPLVQGFLDLNRLLFYRGLCLNWAGKMIGEGERQVCFAKHLSAITYVVVFSNRCFSHSPVLRFIPVHFNCR